jgi:hypothetical protein
MLAAYLPSSTHAQTLVRPEDALVALYSVQTELEVEQKILQREEARYEANVRQRAELRDRIGRVYVELEELFKSERDAAAGGRESGPTEAEIRATVEAKEAEVRGLESAESSTRDEGRSIRWEIRRIRSRITFIQDRLAILRSSLPRDSDSITGIWDITMLPSGDHGVFMLWQSGTIVSGQYVLDGPFRGSLEGTLVNRQVLLRRIDARLGRSMEFSGYLADDGQAVQGTWLNYDLSSGRKPTGQWSARKRSSTPSEGARPAGESGPRE